jgi:hypothetical protein
MPLLGNFVRLRRGDMNWFILAALVALLVLPGAGHAATMAAPLPPQSCEAILLWLQTESAVQVMPARFGTESHLLALTHRIPERAPQRTLTFAPAPEGPAVPVSPLAAPRLHDPLSRPLLLLEYHEAGHRTGIRTNRRLN